MAKKKEKMTKNSKKWLFLSNLMQKRLFYKLFIYIEFHLFLKNNMLIKDIVSNIFILFYISYSILGIIV